MKRSECNIHQQRAWSAVTEAYNEIVGGWENTLLDYEPETDNYKEADAILKSPTLNEDIYYLALKILGWSENAKETRFASKAFIMERINRRLTKDGYTVPNWTKNENL